MSTITHPTDDGEQQCSECGEPFDSMDELVDHLSDVHDAFDWIVEGRPIGGANK